MATSREHHEQQDLLRTDIPPLRLVNADTGELVDPEDCPRCYDLEDQLAGAENNIRSLRKQLADAKRDREAQARGHNLWPEAVSVFRYWQQQTGKHRASFSPDRFWLLEPFIRRDGAAECRKAIRGCMASDFHRKGGYVGLEQIFDTRGKFERHRDNDPEQAPSLVHLSLIETAKEVAERVLERAKLIEAGEDPPALAHLLVEVDRLIYRWRQAPEVGE